MCLDELDELDFRLRLGELVELDELDFRLRLGELVELDELDFRLRLGELEDLECFLCFLDLYFLELLSDLYFFKQQEAFRFLDSHFNLCFLQLCVDLRPTL